MNRSILPSGRIGLAVSGGSDSVALAFLLTKGGKKKKDKKSDDPNQMTLFDIFPESIKGTGAETKSGTQKPAQDASRFKPLTSTAKQPAPTGETQTFKPVRGNNPTQVYQPIRPAVTETIIPDSTAQWKPVQQHTTATTAEKGATPLNPPVKASAAPESAPASSDSAPKPRVRRTERNKDMYDQNNKA